MQGVALRGGAAASSLSVHEEQQAQFWYARDNATIMSADVGSWTPTADCPTPKLWIVLTGHFRSFLATQGNFAALANESSAGCFLVAALLPQMSNEWERNRRHCFVDNQYRDDVTPLLRRASVVFGGRFAFATATPMRTFSVERARQRLGPRSLPSLWCASYLWTLVVAESLNIRIDAASVVLLTRPDKVYTHALGLDVLQRYFRHGTHGRHLLLGQEGGAAAMLQADHHMMSSFAAFHADIGLPFTTVQQGAGVHGDDLDNNCVINPLSTRLGYGQSMLGLGPFNNLSRCTSRCSPACICLDGKARCDWPTCYSIVIESFTSPRSSLLRDFFPSASAYQPGRPYELATTVKYYCPADGKKPTCAHDVNINPYWIPQDRFYKCSHAVPLRLNGSWPCAVASDESCFPHGRKRPSEILATEVLDALLRRRWELHTRRSR